MKILILTMKAIYNSQSKNILPKFFTAKALSFICPHYWSYYYETCNKLNFLSKFYKQ